MYLWNCFMLCRDHKDNPLIVQSSGLLFVLFLIVSKERHGLLELSFYLKLEKVKEEYVVFGLEGISHIFIYL